MAIVNIIIRDDPKNLGGLIVQYASSPDFPTSPILMTQAQSLGIAIIKQFEALQKAMPKEEAAKLANLAANS